MGLKKLNLILQNISFNLDRYAVELIFIPKHLGRPEIIF